jgi:flagellar basal-body rod protein FlgC
MGLFDSFRISGSGLTAERLRMDTIANNLANANTTRTEQGGPYRRQMVVFSAINGDSKPYKKRIGGGVKVVGITQDPALPKLVYDPQHPDANEDGYVAFPNVNVVTEMVDLITATRAYEANITAINAAKSMALKALDIGRV